MQTPVCEHMWRPDEDLLGVLLHCLIPSGEGFTEPKVFSFRARPGSPSNALPPVFELVLPNTWITAGLCHAQLFTRVLGI